MYYTAQIGQILSQLNSFLSNNQILLTTALLIGAYFLKRFIDAKAANPQKDIWDSIKPGSDALYALAHRGVEYLGKAKGMDKAAKLLEYLKIIEQFERDWQSDRIAAVKRLAAWYLSMQGKQIAANPSTEPLTADSVAVESSKT
jgi:hypothetical protein